MAAVYDPVTKPHQQQQQQQQQPPDVVVAVIHHPQSPVATGQPQQQPQGTVYNPIAWRYGLCGCLEDTDECLDTCFCTYCKFGRMGHRLEHNEVGFNWMWCAVPFVVDVGVAVAFFYLFGGGGGGFGTVMATSMLRQKLKHRYDIREGGCESAIYAVCIPVCALCQQSREMAHRGEYCGGTVCSKPPAESAPMSATPVVTGSATPVANYQSAKQI